MSKRSKRKLPKWNRSEQKRSFWSMLFGSKNADNEVLDTSPESNNLDFDILKIKKELDQMEKDEKSDFSI